METEKSPSRMRPLAKLAVTLGAALSLAAAAQAADAKTQSASAPVSASVPAAASGKTHRIVFQVTIDGEENWNAVLNQIENVQKGFAPDKVEIEVVTHGNASGFVLAKNTAVSERIRKIETTGAVFSYCANTQKKFNVKTAELTPGVTIVPSGLVEVVKRQEEGWSYIKGGS